MSYDYRIRDWIKILGYPAIASLFVFSFESFLLNMVSASMILAYSFSLNDYFDAKFSKESNFFSDKTNYKGFLIALAPLMLIPPILSKYTLTSRIILGLCILLVTTYSSPPFRLRDKPVLSVFENALMFPLVFAWPYLEANPVNGVFWCLMTAFISYFAVAEIIHQIDHKVKDKKTGRITYATKYGTNQCKRATSQITAVTIAILSVFLMGSPTRMFAVTGIIANIMRRQHINRNIDDFHSLRTKLFAVEEGLVYAALAILS